MEDSLALLLCITTGSLDPENSGENSGGGGKKLLASCVPLPLVCRCDNTYSYYQTQTGARGIQDSATQTTLRPKTENERFLNELPLAPGAPVKINTYAHISLKSVGLELLVW